jgi:hypothetical protein
MARLAKSIFGSPSGKIGDLIFKIRNGKVYISTAPVNVKVSNSPKSIKSRNSFGFMGSLSCAVIKNFYINLLWDKSEIPCENARNKFSHINSPLLAGSRDLNLIRLVPSEELFPAVLLSAESEDDKITLTFEPFDVPYIDLFFPLISAHGFFHLYDANEAAAKAHYFIPVISAKIPYLKGAGHTFTIPFDNTMISKYNSIELCITLIFENQSGEPVYCSENVIC